jgi:hypothetical protein
MENNTTQTNPYNIFDNKFCKVVIKEENNSTKALKGTISIISNEHIRVKGSYIDTVLHIGEILKITTKQHEVTPNERGYNKNI